MARRLTQPVTHAWRMAAQAAQAGALESARAYADRAIELSGWDRYDEVQGHATITIRCCDELARGWMYHARRGRWEHLLLLHPDNLEFVTELGPLGTMMRGLYEGPGGLLRLDEVLSPAMLGAFDVPDDASGL